MNPMVVLLAVVVGVIGFIVGHINRAKPAEPKPFGLEAFEAHGLGRASGDVLKAVVATISFLGHPFVVVEEAVEAMATADTSAVRNRLQVAENLEEIALLQTYNIGLEGRAQVADARASALNALVTQVSSVVGK